MPVPPSPGSGGIGVRVPTRGRPSGAICWGLRAEHYDGEASGELRFVYGYAQFYLRHTLHRDTRITVNLNDTNTKVTLTLDEAAQIASVLTSLVARAHVPSEGTK